mgnify:CR=1 FL=1
MGCAGVGVWMGGKALHESEAAVMIAWVNPCLVMSGDNWRGAGEDRGTAHTGARSQIIRTSPVPPVCVFVVLCVKKQQNVCVCVCLCSWWRRSCSPSLCCCWCCSCGQPGGLRLAAGGCGR